MSLYSCSSKGNESDSDLDYDDLDELVVPSDADDFMEDDDGGGDSDSEDDAEAVDEEEVEFVKCSELNAQRAYGLTQVPALVYFENGVPSVYPGDLKNDDEVLGWISAELSNQNIEEVRDIPVWII